MRFENYYVIVCQYIPIPFSPWTHHGNKLCVCIIVDFHTDTWILIWFNFWSILIVHEEMCAFLVLELILENNISCLYYLGIKNDFFNVLFFLSEKLIVWLSCFTFIQKAWYVNNLVHTRTIIVRFWSVIMCSRDVVEGLSHLHNVGIIHRDLKPHNVLISFARKPQAKLSDMGISKQLADGVTTLPCQSAGMSYLILNLEFKNK